MLVIMKHYQIFCNTCDWAICWFGEDPWADNVVCPHHPGKKQVDGCNRDGDPARYFRSFAHFGEEHRNAYGAIPITPDMINERGTVELWRGKKNL